MGTAWSETSEKSHSCLQRHLRDLRSSRRLPFLAIEILSTDDEASELEESLRAMPASACSSSGDYVPSRRYSLV